MSNTHRNDDGSIVANQNHAMPLDAAVDAATLQGQAAAYYTNAAHLTGALPTLDGAALANLTKPTSANGSFTTTDLKTVTVVSGVITSIA